MSEEERKNLQFMLNQLLKIRNKKEVIIMQTTITKENIEKFQSYGFVLTPVNKSSNPVR